MEFNNATIPMQDFEMNAAASDLWKWIVFAVQGTFMVAMNVPIFATVFRHASLRGEKQFVIISGLALADAGNGLAFLAAGLYRSFLVAINEHNLRVTAWQCAMTLHNLLWFIFETAPSVMLLVVSIDRLISVIIPLKYLKLSSAYAWHFIGCAFGYSTITAFVALGFSYTSGTGAIYPKVCYTVSATGDTFYGYFGTTVVLAAFASVGIYVIIGIYMHSSKRNPQRNEPWMAKREMAMQKRMTESLAISCFFTLILYCVPYGLAALLLVVAPAYSSLSIIFWMLTNVNPMINVVIYLVRQHEMRQGIVALLIGKTMPPSLHSWPVAKPRKVTRSTVVQTIEHR